MAVPYIFGALCAKTYDAIYGNKNYAHECDILEQLFETKSSVISILDLGCGTGGHAAELSKRDYRIAGLDHHIQHQAAAPCTQIELVSIVNIPAALDDDVGVFLKDAENLVACRHLFLGEYAALGLINDVQYQ